MRAHVRVYDTVPVSETISVIMFGGRCVYLWRQSTRPAEKEA